MEFSIIIPAYQSAVVLQLCVESIIHTVHYLSEVIIIDDNSPKETQNYLKQLPHYDSKLISFTVIHNTKSIGSVKAINKGLEKATGQFIVFLDSDVILADGWQEQMKKSLLPPDIGAVGGILVYPQTGGIQSCGITFSSYVGRHLFLNNRLSVIQEHYNQGFEINAVVFALCGFKRQIFDKIGKLNESFFNGYEDYDFMFRIRSSGWKIITNPYITGMHFEKSNGIHRQTNRKANMGLFWNLHAGEQICDLWNFMSSEVKLCGIGNEIYIGIDLSEVRNDAETAWDNLSSYLKIKHHLDYSSLVKEKHISLLEMLSPDLICEPMPFLFLCDNFIQMLYNSYWYSLRSVYCNKDVIIDLCGNCILFKQLDKQSWPGTKIR